MKKSSKEVRFASFFSHQEEKGMEQVFFWNLTGLWYHPQANRFLYVVDLTMTTDNDD